MKQFVKDNSSIIFKFMITHIVMSILGIMVGLAVLSIEGQTQGMSAIAIIGSLFTIGFMCFMHYDDMYFVAVKEGIRKRTDGEPIDTFKGLKICLIAYSPVLISGLVAIIFDLFVNEHSVITLFIYYIFQGSFLGLYKIRETLGVTVYVIVTLLPALISGSLGYAIGVKDKTLRGVMGMNVKPPFDGPMERKPKNKGE